MYNRALYTYINVCTYIAPVMEAVTNTVFMVWSLAWTKPRTQRLQVDRKPHFRTTKQCYTIFMSNIHRCPNDYGFFLRSEASPACPSEKGTIKFKKNMEHWWNCARVPKCFT